MIRVLALCALALAMPAGAVERIRLQAASITVEDMALHGVEATLRIPSAGESSVELKAARATLPSQMQEQAGTIRALHARCAALQVRDPEFSCRELQIGATSSRWGARSFRGRAAFHSDTLAVEAQGASSGPGGMPLQLSLAADPDGFEAGVELAPTAIDELARLLQDYAELPAGFTVTGNAGASARIVSRGGTMQATLELDLADAGFQNEDYTWIGEKLALSAQAQADLSASAWPFTLQVQGTAGQALGGPVLLDLGANPLRLAVSGMLDGQQLTIDHFQSSQQDLARASGSARVRLDPLQIESAQVDVAELLFPAAYPAYVQLPLATTPFNQLQTSGRARVNLAIRDNLPRSIDLAIDDLHFSDASRNLEVSGVNAEVHWRSDVTDVRASFLAWEASRGWGIVGDRTRIEFTTSGRDFQLLEPARLPFFDGALRVNRLAVENIGTPGLSGVFDATIEPISVAPIARALGWPEFQGRLSGSIPGLTYKDDVLSLQGNVEASVFDGTVVARNLSVREPLGPWPRLHADITARNLDLELITRTFEFGSITGRLDADLLNLETFNWAPVAFDLKLATPPGDDSRHRISQRAVQNLSDIGGGGGGVAAALQSGALRFFDEFPYDRLGLSCRLRNDVCQMDGVGRAGTGFYILKGKWLPRIDIIGNNRRVDWPLLMQQVADALSNPGNIDVN